MRAVAFYGYGGPEVLTMTDLPEPHAGPGQVRIRTTAVSVNPIDWKIRAGYLHEMMPTAFPAIPGVDAAGVVDEVGDGVSGFAVGDDVLGNGFGTFAEFAVLNAVAHKPAGMSWTDAAAIPHATETAARCLDMLGVGPDMVVVVEGAAGGVGTAAVQLARRRGATVVGTASEGNHSYLTSFGALATTYGAGLRARLDALGVGPVHAVLDAAGSGSLAELVTLVDDPAQVVSIADFTAGAVGARVSDGAAGRAFYVLDEVVAAHQSGDFVVTVSKILPLEAASAAHELSQTGHVRGKIALTVDG